MRPCDARIGQVTGLLEVQGSNPGENVPITLEKRHMFFAFHGFAYAFGYVHAEASLAPGFLLDPTSITRLYDS
jgi:hypothetical protein